VSRRQLTSGPYVIANMSGRTFPELGIAISYAQGRVCAGVPAVTILYEERPVARVWQAEDDAVLTGVYEGSKNGH
jgi:hypothetical protein